MSKSITLIEMYIDMNVNKRRCLLEMYIEQTRVDQTLSVKALSA